MRLATENGFKCVVVNFRGTSGVKLTTAKSYSGIDWEDYKEGVDYIFEKYCSGEDGY